DDEAGRRGDGQLGGNQVLVARFVRLRVETFGQRDFQRDARRLAGMGGFLDERRHVRARPPHLRGCARHEDAEERTDEKEENRRAAEPRPAALCVLCCALCPCLYHFTSRNGITGSATGSTAPFTGGRS